MTFLEIKTEVVTNKINKIKLYWKETYRSH